MTESDTGTEREFRADIQQVLDILIHSLYSEREIFLRELISNASDALSRFKLERLKRQSVTDPEAELGIWLSADPEARTLTLRDSGVGLSEAEMEENLGTIARSGAKSFIEAMKALNGGDSASTREVIGQFGVGFYSAFMVADEVTVTSRSLDPEASAAFWRSQGQGTYEVGPAEHEARGTTITLKLKEDALEYAQVARLRELVKAHSDYIPFPIYLEEGGNWTQINSKTALWREAPRSVPEAQTTAFYQQLTFDMQDPLLTVHFAAEMPIQFYALLFVPSKRDYKIFRNAEDYGLRLYARKVLIDPTYRELLPPYLRFVEGVVDSEDLPLNVSREMVQTTPVVARIRKALVGRVLSELGDLAKDDSERYSTFYREFGVFLKEGIASDPTNAKTLEGLLRFSSSAVDLTSLSDYVSRMKPEQKEIYYALGDDLASVKRSSHLEAFAKRELEVLYLTEPIDPFMLFSLSEFDGKALKNIDDADLELPEDETKLELPKDEAFISLAAFVKNVLGERVESVRESKVLSQGAARLVSPGGASSLYRAQRLMGQETQEPPRILELNPTNELIKGLEARLQANDQDPLLHVAVEQLFDNERLAEGLHPNPAEMIPRIQSLLTEALRPK